MKRIAYICFTGSLLLLFGCENEIAFRGEQTAQQMVLNTKIVEGTAVSAKLTNSIFFLSNDTMKYITDADMRLYVDDQFVEQLTATEIIPEYFAPSESAPRRDAPMISYEPYWVYVGNYVPKRGERIRIEATAPGFEGKVWGEDTVPQAPAVTKIDYSVIDTNPAKPQTVRLKIHIDDPADERNFYVLRVLAMTHCIRPDGSKYEMTFDVEYSDAVFSDTQMENPLIYIEDGESSSTQHTFTDELFNGNDDYPLTVSCQLYSRPEGEIDFGYSVYIDQMSESYYNFLVTRAKYNSNSFLSEPVQVYNNMVGGIGVIGTYTPWKKSKNYYFNTIYTEDE